MEDFLNIGKMDKANLIAVLKKLGRLATEKVEVSTGSYGLGGVGFVNFSGFKTPDLKIAEHRGVTVYPAERGGYGGGEKGYILRVRALGKAYFVPKNAIEH